MVGFGNDFIVIDNRTDAVKDRYSAAITLCDRKFGIGTDGLIASLNTPNRRYTNAILNPDGSEGGDVRQRPSLHNAFCYQQRHCDKNSLTVETGAGILKGTVNGAIVKAQLKITDTQKQTYLFLLRKRPCRDISSIQAFPTPSFSPTT